MASLPPRFPGDLPPAPEGCRVYMVISAVRRKQPMKPVLSHSDRLLSFYHATIPNWVEKQTLMKVVYYCTLILLRHGLRHTVLGPFDLHQVPVIMHENIQSPKQNTKARCWPSSNDVARRLEQHMQTTRLATYMALSQPPWTRVTTTKEVEKFLDRNEVNTFCYKTLIWLRLIIF